MVQLYCILFLVTSVTVFHCSYLHSSMCTPHALTLNVSYSKLSNPFTVLTPSFHPPLLPATSHFDLTAYESSGPRISGLAHTVPPVPDGSDVSDCIPRHSLPGQCCNGHYSLRNGTSLFQSTAFRIFKYRV